MNAKLNQIDRQGQIILNQKNAGTISQAQYDARLKKLVERAAAILARQS